MLNLVIGTKHKPVQSDALLTEVQGLEMDEGTLYVGYPILTTPDDKTTIDALLISPDCGVVIFDLLGSVPPQGADAYWEDLAEHQNQMALGLTAKLMVHKALTQRRGLGFEINVVTFAPSGTKAPSPDLEFLFATQGSLGDLLKTLPPLPAQYRAPLNAAIERVSNIKPRNKRASVVKEHSRGAIIKAIEKEIANLDQWQKKGAIESPDGPQRIRGLAGSGKTVVLALKAAYLHAQHPEWTIGVTFWTRSLYEQFQDFIRRFSFEHSNDEPDWTKLRILHGWGTPREPGVYSVIAGAHGAPVRDFAFAKNTYGRREAFDGVCREVLEAQGRGATGQPIFDALLVDEAQDFPPEFFQMVHNHLGEPKRLIWAYDELQNLNETTMPPLSTLFGTDKTGAARVKLHNDAGKPAQDIILPVCYRNPPWTLAIAHALGFGIYRKSTDPSALVQMFDDPRLWQDIGYHVASGSLTPQANVSLERRPEASPKFFTTLLQDDESFQARECESDAEQAILVADEIAKNLTDDELEPSDILVVFPNPITVPEDAGPLVVALRDRGIQTHIAGATTRRDQFFVEGSVTISGIYRAKGNEAPMVYLLGAEHCARGPELLRKRNTVFTALTRSRAWVRMFGVGPRMRDLLDEINEIRNKQYRLEFRVPTDEELAKLRSIHRDRTEGEKQRAEAAAGAFKTLVDDLQAGVVSIEDLSPADRKKLASILLKSK